MIVNDDCEVESNDKKTLKTRKHKKKKMLFETVC